MSCEKDNPLDKEILKTSLKDSFFKLDPKIQIQKFIMFVVYLGAIIATSLYVMSFFGVKDSLPRFTLSVAVFLWATVLVGNFAGSVVEGYRKKWSEPIKCEKRGQSEISLRIFLNSLTLVFILVTFSLYFYVKISSEQLGETATLSITHLVAFLVCLLPTTAGALILPMGISKKITGGKKSRINSKKISEVNSDSTNFANTVNVDKHLLTKKSALTIFDIASNVAKYFAIIPALFITLYPNLSALDVMKLSSPESAVLSVVIYNFMVMVVLIPIVLKGFNYKGIFSNKLLLRNILIYGLGGLIIPFVAIKLIDLLISFMGIF